MTGRDRRPWERAYNSFRHSGQMSKAGASYNRRWLGCFIGTPGFSSFLYWPCLDTHPYACLLAVSPHRVSGNKKPINHFRSLPSFLQNTHVALILPHPHNVSWQLEASVPTSLLPLRSSLCSPPYSNSFITWRLWTQGEAGRKSIYFHNSV